MNRFLLALVPLALLTAVGWADNPSRREAERILQLQRDRHLIRTLVERGLHLAGEEDPLKRADHLGGLAEQMASEIQTAAKQGEDSRVAELGEHLKAIFEKGLVETLKAASPTAAPGSSQEQKMNEVRKRTAKTVKDLEAGLAEVTDEKTKAQLRRVLEGAAAGRDTVDRAGRRVFPTR